jgi:protein-L-isoaspartate(D-aspartate) O-methyltransferase
MDFARARTLMVESQVRVEDVTDPRILGAMRRLPRERFAPAALATLAYADLELEVAPGRRLLRPRDLSKLIHALAPKPSERALELAGGTAYGAAVLAACVQEVVALDPSAALSFAANTALTAAGVANVRPVSTELAAGWAEAAPYDVILLNGAAEIIPEAWFAQLAEGGRMGVIVRDGAAGSARIYLKSGGAVAFYVAFDASPCLAPCLARPAAFTF